MQLRFLEVRGARSRSGPATRKVPQPLPSSADTLFIKGTATTRIHGMRDRKPEAGRCTASFLAVAGPGGQRTGCARCVPLPTAAAPGLGNGASLFSFFSF